MSDELDFDELDAAVNDLFSRDQDDSEASLDRARIAQIAQDSNNSSQDTTDITQPEPPTAVPTARRFRGQFIDMIHPSSDVNVANKPNNAPDQKNKAATQQTTDTTADGRSDKLKSDDTPSDLNDKLGSDNVPRQQDDSRDKDSTAMHNGEIPDHDEEDSFESPFLPDAAAKVASEKRSLGTPSAVVDWIREFTDAQVTDSAPTKDPMKSTSVSGAARDYSPATKNPYPFTQRKALPADDSGRGELQPALNETNFITKYLEEVKDQNSINETDNIINRASHVKTDKSTGNNLSKVENSDGLSSNNHDSIATDERHRPSSNNKSQHSFVDTHAALANTMIMPQYKAASPKQLVNDRSPYYATAVNPSSPSKKRSLSVAGWVLVFILIALTGVAAGAWLYYSGLF